MPLRSQQPDSSRPIVALLEARMSSELARLVDKHGGGPLSVPAVREAAQLPNSGAVEQLLSELKAAATRSWSS